MLRACADPSFPAPRPRPPNPPKKQPRQIQLPAWADIAKTAHFKELCPQDVDWYYVRAAAIARKVYCSQGLGVGGMRYQFGGSMQRGAAPEHFARASGGVIRHCLKSLETIGIVEKHAARGRKISASGQRDMDLIAGRCKVDLEAY